MNVLSEIRAIFEELMKYENDTCGAQNTLDIFASYCSDLEIEANQNSVSGFLGIFSDIVELWHELEHDTSNLYLKQAIPYILKEHFAISTSLSDGFNTLYDVTPKVKHVRDLLLAVLESEFSF